MDVLLLLSLYAENAAFTQDKISLRSAFKAKKTQMKMKWLIRLWLPVFLASCGSDQQSVQKGIWSAAERKAFMRDCISAAKNTYQMRGLQPDTALINCLCNNSREIIERRFSFERANKISPAEVDSITQTAAKNCHIK